jgi:hypothetical protein
MISHYLEIALSPDTGMDRFLDSRDFGEIIYGVGMGHPDLHYEIF